MVYHIVMWNFKKDIPEEKKPELKAAMAEHLQSLVGKVPGLLTVEFVTEPVSASTHEIALVTTMEKAEDVAVYGSHPEHVAVADTYVRPYVCDRACLNYQPKNN
ncbi:MAG: Dabb family protein [Lachnospiraceae bacterium]|nr:Dabb family protein [Lachnospiraceae bacterium]